MKNRYLIMKELKRLKLRRDSCERYSLNWHHFNAQIMALTWVIQEDTNDDPPEYQDGNYSFLDSDEW